jgi:hypothetical protein
MRGTMRGTISVSIPLETSADQLAAVASLLSAIEAARWEHLARSFTRMEATGAVIAPPMAEVLGRLAQELRAAGREREPAPAGRLGP